MTVCSSNYNHIYFHGLLEMVTKVFEIKIFNIRFLETSSKDNLSIEKDCI